MNNLEKEFVPYEQALALKKLGFDEPCLATYNGETLDLQLQIPSDDYFTIAPLFQQAFRWFREKYKKVDYPEFDYDEQKWYCHSNYQSHILFDTCEEAELECLVKLIETVKNGK